MPLPDAFVFVDAAVLGPDDFLVAAHDAAALAQSRHVTHLLRRRHGEWHDLARWAMQVVGLAVPATTPLRAEVLGRDGEVGVVDNGTVSQEVLEAGRALGPLRGITVAFGRVIAHGMQRHVYLRDADGAWIRFDAGLGRPPRQPGESISAYLRRGATADGGIDAVLAHGTDQLHAFGLRGEIWRFRTDTWCREASPVDTMLRAAAVADDGSAWVCGQHGTLLRGRDGDWQPFEHTGPAGLDFRDVALFGGHVYLADGHALRRLEGHALAVVEAGAGVTMPCNRLAHGEGTLLALAGQELWTSRDGHTWTSLAG